MKRIILLMVFLSFLIGCGGSDKLSKTYRKGLSYYNEKEYDSAIEEFTNVVEMDEKYVMAYMMRGSCNAALKKHDDAIKDFSKVIDLDSQNRNAYINRSLSYKATGKVNQAKADLEKSKKIND